MKKYRFRVFVDGLDELFGNCWIYTYYKKQLIQINHTHIPQEEINPNRIHEEIQRVVFGGENPNLKILNFKQER